MICRLHGTLDTLADGAAHLTVEGGLTYRVLLPAYLLARLADQVGRPITLHTIHWLEGGAQGGNLTPRLAGFLTPADRDFFELFTSVNRVGPRKALRAMALSTDRIAAAIADRDVRMLQSLPEIGKRTAETIVASLHGKIDRFISETTYAARASSPAAPGSAPAPTPTHTAAHEALEVLLQLGEPRTQAIAWIDEALTRRPELDDSQQLIAEVLRHRIGP